MTIAQNYTARVNAVLNQRTRLRGPQPEDVFEKMPPKHPLLVSDARRPLDPNLQVIASSYLKPEDLLLDVGGGSGRYSLPLALSCREVINIDPSPTMIAGFAANAERAGIKNIRSIAADWLEIDPPPSDIALVAHVLYLTLDIVPFIEKLQQSVRRRILILVNDPPPPSWNRVLFEYLFGEKEEIVPGHVELVDVLQEMGIKPEIQPLGPMSLPPSLPPTREAAIQVALGAFLGEQWGFWPLGSELEERLRKVLQTRFDELFIQTPNGFKPGWIQRGNEVLLTWQTPNTKINPSSFITLRREI